MNSQSAESSVDGTVVSTAQQRSTAVIFRGGGDVDLSPVDLVEPGDGDVIVDVHWSGVSTGTERLLWSSDMPPFPGLSYPLVPGYEAVGIARTGALAGHTVFVPGAICFKDVAGLFGASASRLIVPAEKLVRLEHAPRPEDTLFALAATAHHAIAGAEAPDLIIGHGVLGRLIARIVIALGHPPPTVWETNPARQDGDGYSVIDPSTETRTDYRSICEVSGDISVIDASIARAGKGALITLAGFYSDRPSFAFPPAFMKEIRLRVAAEWSREDLDAVLALRQSGQLRFDGLVTHKQPARDAAAAYPIAFNDPTCLKMALDWRSTHDHAH